MNIFKTLLSKIELCEPTYNWVPLKQYDDLCTEYEALKIKYGKLKDEYFNTKQVLEDSLVRVQKNYGNYVYEKSLEINKLKDTIEPLNKTVISLNSEIETLLYNNKVLKVNVSREIEEHREALNNEITNNSIVNRFLWALLFISMFGNFLSIFNVIKC